MIYLDYSANTPVDEAVLQRFCEVERNCPGNANSRHAAGTAAKAAIDAATQSIARSLNVQPAETADTARKYLALKQAEQNRWFAARDKEKYQDEAYFGVL